MALADVDTDGLVGCGFDAEAVDGGGGFYGLGCLTLTATGVVDGPAWTGGVFEDDGAGVGGGVVDEVLDFVDVEGGLLEDAFVYGDVFDAVGVIGVVGGDADGLVGCVGEKAALVGVDGIEEAFAAEVSVFDDGEGAAVESEVGGVGDPEGAQGYGLLCRPEGYAFGVNLGLEDGDQGGLVFVDGDGFRDLVLEVVVEGVGGGVGGEGVGG